jgi:glucose/arabinose dehydrogenase
MKRWWMGAPFLLACSLLTPPPADTPVVEGPPPATETSPPFTPSPVPTPRPTAVTTLPDPSTAGWALVVDGYGSPVDLQSAGERLYVVEQEGVIRVIDAGVPIDGPVLDIRERVGASSNEQGLLGLAFHPRWEENGFFFVNYTDRAGDTVIARYRMSDPVHVDPAGEEILLTYDQPYPNHNGGGLEFGPDGYLYIAAGDGGSAGDPEDRAQNPDSPLGKILRVDVDDGAPYAVPSDNPFASGGGRPEIWAMGLRNPWRFTFDPSTGEIYIGDVGQGEWEEIDYLPAGSPGGANFGWDFREGAHAYEGEAPAGLIEPVAEYSHAGGHCSVTAGEVVRDASLTAWQGVFLYGDYCSGTVWGLLRDAAGVWSSTVMFQTGMQITSFGRGSAGEVYLVDRGGGVYRLTAQ